MPSESTHDHLRRITRADHDGLEQRLDIVSHLSDPARRRALVTRFWLMHLDCERVLAPMLDGVPGLDYPARRKSAILAADLAALGGAAPGIEAVPDPARAATRGEALGMLYVLEGSTLGGRVIAKSFAANGGTLDGLAHLDVYGARTGERWRDLLAVLEREAAAGGLAMRDDMARGASRCFAHVGAWLTGEPVAG